MTYIISQWCGLTFGSEDLTFFIFTDVEHLFFCVRTFIQGFYSFCLEVSVGQYSSGSIYSSSSIPFSKDKMLELFPLRYSAFCLCYGLVYFQLHAAASEFIYIYIRSDNPTGSLVLYRRALKKLLYFRFIYIIFTWYAEEKITYYRAILH